MISSKVIRFSRRDAGARAAELLLGDGRVNRRRSRRTWPRCATGSPRRRGRRARGRGGDPGRRREVATRGADRGRARRRPAGVRRELRPGSPAAVAGPAADLAGVELHLIGHLQSNKAAEAVALFDAIQTLDRPKLARELAKRCSAGGAPRVQVRHGRGAAEVGRGAGRARPVPRLVPGRARARGRGADGDPARGRRRGPAQRSAKLARRHGLAALSVGMSGDFEAAIRFGATHVGGDRDLRRAPQGAAERRAARRAIERVACRSGSVALVCRGRPAGNPRGRLAGSS